MELRDDRRRGFGAFAGFLERFDFLWSVRAFRVNGFEAQRPLYRDLPVAESGVGKDLRLLRFLEAAKCVSDARDVFFG